MSEIHPILKKLQWKETGKAVLVLNAPSSYEETTTTFEGRVDKEVVEEKYGFVQVFGTSNEEVSTLSKSVVNVLEEDGILWLCYPKKSSKAYKGSDCSRDTVAKLLANEGFEPVRNVAIDEDWSALRFRKVENIKKMVRKFAHTEAGKKRTNDQ
ncbi:DUF3052 domain-containing protein [Psychrobacillus sp. FSL H8-0483]|uniref:DUF3052 domain-containing protein n=1 Tax=Psychrobacillus sp. FSL H8-0483 TaxID=2921389 RepID=UPI00315A75EB